METHKYRLMTTHNTEKAYGYSRTMDDMFKVGDIFEGTLLKNDIEVEVVTDNDFTVGHSYHIDDLKAVHG